MNTSFQPSRRVLVRGVICAGVVLVLAGCKTPSETRQPTAKADCAVADASKTGRVIDLQMDSTTLFPDPFVHKVVDNLLKVVGPGDRVRVQTFGGRKPMSVPQEVMIVGGADRWRDSPKEAARKAACEKQTRAALANLVRHALTQHDANPPSPIFESLMLYSMAVREEPTPHVLAIFSDGVQWSDKIQHIARGRAAGALALPSADDLIARLTRLGLLPSSLPPVVHFGLGLPDGPTETHPARSAAEVIRLKGMWQAYYRAAKAPHAEIGAPYPSQGIPAVQQ